MMDMDTLIYLVVMLIILVGGERQLRKVLRASKKAKRWKRKLKKVVEDGR